MFAKFHKVGSATVSARRAASRSPSRRACPTRRRPAAGTRPRGARATRRRAARRPSSAAATGVGARDRAIYKRRGARLALPAAGFSPRLVTVRTRSSCSAVRPPSSGARAPRRGGGPHLNTPAARGVPSPPGALRSTFPAARARPTRATRRCSGRPPRPFNATTSRRLCAASPPSRRAAARVPPGARRRGRAARALHVHHALHTFDMPTSPPRRPRSRATCRRRRDRGHERPRCRAEMRWPGRCYVDFHRNAARPRRADFGADVVAVDAAARRARGGDHARLVDATRAARRARRGVTEFKARRQRVGDEPHVLRRQVRAVRERRRPPRGRARRSRSATASRPNRGQEGPRGDHA